MGAFLIVCYGKSAEEAFHPFKHLQLVPFRDAGEEPCNYECSVLDCLRGLERAVSYSWYNYLKFDYKEYEFNHKLDNGDMNWVVPNKIIALSSPTDIRGEGLPPSHFLESFIKMRVKGVIRLNEQLYDEAVFRKQNINVYDMEFLDGSCPDDNIIQSFINIVDQEVKIGGAVAVHCRAGLGRTGTLIAAYIMNKYNFEPRALIGWLRIARPGSIIGIQQQFLVDSYLRIKQMNGTTSSLSTINSQLIRQSKEELVKSIPVRGYSGMRQLNGRPLATAQIFKRDENIEQAQFGQVKIQNYFTGKSTQGDQLVERRKKKLTSYMGMIDQLLVKDKLRS